MDSRGNPTVEAEITLADGTTARSGVPSGASTGSHEALELRDQDKGRFGGKGVLSAVNNITSVIAPKLMDRDPTDQESIDRLLIDLDGTENKAALGANAILAVSLATAHVAAAAKKVKLYEHLAELYGNPSPQNLPIPLLNLVNCGQHGHEMISLQEFMIVPLGFTSFREAYTAAVEVFAFLHGLSKKEKWFGGFGDEGGVSPSIVYKGHAKPPSVDDIFSKLWQAVETCGYKLGKDIYFALDCAASEFYDADSGKYLLRKGTQDEELMYSGEQLISFYEELRSEYPICSIEDPLAEDDWEHWVKMSSSMGRDCQIIGDDHLVTSIDRLERAIERKSCNGILIKLNQIGTLSETLSCIRRAQASGFATIISHRSGETEDTTISHLTVATNSGQIKAGAPRHSDRTAKYNELLRIEDHIREQRGESTFGRLDPVVASRILGTGSKPVTA
jgi:enolase